MSPNDRGVTAEREIVLPALYEQWSVLTEFLAGVSGDAWFTPTALPGWTVHDITAHLIGTESMLAGVAAPHTDIDVHALPHVRNEIGAFNERWVEGLRGRPGTEMVDLFRDVVERRRTALDAMSDEELGATTATPVGPAPYLRFMRIRVFDCWMHELDLRDALGRPGTEDGPRAAVAFEEVLGALGFVVGKKAKAPAGSSVTFELTGPAPRTVHVAVDERASVVEELPTPATTTLRLGRGLFIRLAGGRVRGVDHSDEIEVTGDVRLGKQVVDNLAFTI